MIAFIENSQAYIALGILLILFVAFLSERYSPEITAAGAALFVALGFVDTKEVMGVFSSSAPITIAAMFIISAALVRTGVLEKVSDRVMSKASDRPVLPAHRYPHEHHRRHRHGSDDQPSVRDLTGPARPTTRERPELRGSYPSRAGFVLSGD